MPPAGLHAIFQITSENVTILHKTYIISFIKKKKLGRLPTATPATVAVLPIVSIICQISTLWGSSFGIVGAGWPAPTVDVEPAPPAVAEAADVLPTPEQRLLYYLCPPEGHHPETR